MIKEIIKQTKNIESKIIEIMTRGFYFSFAILFIAFLVSLTYTLNPVSHIIYQSGIILFKTGLTFAIMFFISGFVINTIKNK